MPKPLPDDLEPRVRRLAFIGGRTAAQIHRELAAGADGQQPLKVSYPTVVRLVRDLRHDPIAPPPELSPAGMAGRILRLLDRELARIEEAPSSVDVERLDRIARTLRTIDPIRPKAEERRESSLRSLLEQDAPSSESAAEGDTSAETPSRDGNAPLSRAD